MSLRTIARLTTSLQAERRRLAKVRRELAAERRQMATIEARWKAAVDECCIATAERTVALEANAELRAENDHLAADVARLARLVHPSHRPEDQA